MWLVKIGGRLIDDHPTALPGLVRVLSKLRRQQTILAVTGGGRSADLVRRLDKEHSIGNTASHWMAIAGMELNGYRLAAMYPEAFDPQDAMRPATGGLIPLLLPTDFLEVHPLPESWDVTSDSIAAHLAHHLGAVPILVKPAEPHLGHGSPVDGPSSVSPEELLAREHLPIDRYLPDYLSLNHMDAILVNGIHPERLESIVKGRPTRYTVIKGRGA